MCYRVWQDGRFMEIDTPHELADRVLKTLAYYEDQMNIAKNKAGKTKEEVAAEIRNEYEEENEDLKERLRFSIASVYSEKERDAYHSFVTKHLTCRQNKIDSGKLPWIKQVSTGIGIATTIRCPVCGEQEDITDTSVW